MRDYASLALRFALGLTFLYSVADRFGALGSHGAPNVSWGDFSRFTAYVGVLNWYLPRRFVSSLAWIDTIVEVFLGFALIIGLRLKLVSILSGLVLLAFAITMSVAIGIGAPFAYSVFTASAGAFLLASCHSSRWTLDSRMPRTPLGQGDSKIIS